MTAPVLEILEDLATAELHAAAWKACSGKGWYFGHGSHDESEARLWKMDLEDQPVFGALWEQMRTRCEELAGAPLRGIRVPEGTPAATRGAVLEDLVIDALVSDATVTERAATPEDLRSLE